jgi:mannosyl-3-phosphoglycerate phosphatase
MELIQSDLKLHHPFISENGGGLFLRHGYFQDRPAAARDAQNYQVIDCGRPYYLVAEALRETARRVDIAVTGFNDMSIEDVADECRLSLAQARLAKLREYDEPFRLVDSNPAAYSRICRDLRRRGIRCFTHETFHHATSVADQAQSLRLLISLYQKAHGGPILTVGLARQSRETCLLRAVDIPLVVPSANADPTQFGSPVPTARFISAESPMDGADAILQMLEEHGGRGR